MTNLIAEEVIDFSLTDLIGKHFSMNICGPRKSGKHLFLTNILHITHNFYDQIFVISPMKTFYEPYTNVANIYDMSHTPSLFDNIRQQLTTNKEIKTLIIFDTNNVIEIQKFNQFMCNHIHYNTSVIIVEQIPKLLPVMRQNMDYVFCGKYDTNDTTKSIYDRFFNLVPTLEYFRQLHMKYTHDKSFIGLQNKTLCKYSPCIVPSNHIVSKAKVEITVTKSSQNIGYFIKQINSIIIMCEELKEDLIAHTNT